MGQTRTVEVDASGVRSWFDGQCQAPQEASGERGFQKLDVLKIMLSEAVLLGFLGGLIGVVFSLAAGMAINHFITDDALLVFRPQNFVYIGLAFAFGVGTSLLSGLYPAWKAANERPVEALRS